MMLTPRKAFLTDGAGALLSAILLISVVAPFENVFGLSRNYVITLFIPALAFACYSLGCYYLNFSQWKPLLRIIVVANLVYCVLTLVIPILQRRSVTALGLLYFIGEIVIILTIVRIELITLKKVNHEH